MQTTSQKVSAFTDDVLGTADAVEIASRIAKGEISSREAVEAAIARSKQVSSELNAIATRTYEDAREKSKAPRAGVFSGVPFFIKDTDDVEGVPTGQGSAAVSHHPATANSEFVDHLLTTGVVSLGKSAMPEYGLIPTTESLSTGSTHNPWNLGYSPGGSSGGSAAMVAAGVVPIAHANDGGGSIRIPAACCGLIGLKPSRGRHRDNPVYDYLPIHLVSQGIVSRSVRDTAVFFEALERDYQNPELKPIGKVDGPGKDRLRIAMVTESPTHHDSHPDCVKATEETAKILEGMGHTVEVIPAPFEVELFDDFFFYWAFLAFVIELGGPLMHQQFDRRELEPFTKGLSRHFRQNFWKVPGAIMRLRTAAIERHTALFEKCDVMLTPTMATPPPAHGHLTIHEDFDTMTDRLVEYVPFTPAQNVAGSPGITLPMGFSADGLPIGVQLSGAAGEERRLLELAFEIEEAHPWTMIHDS